MKLYYFTIICAIFFSSYIYTAEEANTDGQEKWPALYAPSRKNYTTHALDKQRGKKDSAQNKCPFCTDLQKKDGKTRNHFIECSKYTFCVLNLNPYREGHILVLPNDHIDSLEKLRPEVAAEMWKKIALYIQVLKKAYHTESLNVGMNIGPHSGASMPKHLHVHLVPRERDDACFLHVQARTTVIGRSLDETCAMLKRLLDEEKNKKSNEDVMKEETNKRKHYTIQTRSQTRSKKRRKL